MEFYFFWNNYTQHFKEAIKANFPKNEDISKFHNCWSSLHLAIVSMRVCDITYPKPKDLSQAFNTRHTDYNIFQREAILFLIYSKIYFTSGII